jgi:hypothetical protein
VSEAAAAVPAPSAPPPAPPAAAESVPNAQNTAEQAPATAPEGEKPETGQDPEKQSSRRFERRLDKAYRKAAEAQARAEFFEKQFNEFKAKAQPPEDPGAPKLENFKDIEEYAQAKAKHASEKALKEHQDKQRSETWKQQQERLSKDWDSKTDRGTDKYDDFQDVVGDIKPTAPWAIAVMEAENGEDIAYHLGTNIKEAERISSLSPTAQIREIGKLEAKLAAEPAKPKTPSKAPAPITPLTGAAPVVGDVPSESDDTAAWIKKRNKQVHGKR